MKYPRFFLVSGFCLLLSSCALFKYNQDVNHAIFHMDLTDEDKAELKTGKELQKSWYGLSEDGGYDSGLLIVTKVPGKNRYHFIHSGRWRNFHKSVIEQDSFETSTVEFYDDLGNQVEHSIRLKKIPDGNWQLFQYSVVKDDAKHGRVMILENYHLNGKLNAHLEWTQPHFFEKKSHKHKDHIFLPERSYYLDESGDSISQEEYNRTVLVWNEKVGRMHQDDLRKD